MKDDTGFIRDRPVSGSALLSLANIPTAINCENANMVDILERGFHTNTVDI